MYSSRGDRGEAVGVGTVGSQSRCYVKIAGQNYASCNLLQNLLGPNPAQLILTQLVQILNPLLNIVIIYCY